MLTFSVSLARAVYSRASTIVLDDVISAVDAHTSQHIINKCFQSPLMAGRTIIIASHAVEALAPLADHAIYLDEGRVQWQGTGPELLESEHMSHLKSETGSSSSVLEDDSAATSEPDLTHMPRKASLPSDIEETSFEVVRVPAKTPRQLLVDEDRAKGAVDFRLWSGLLRMNGGPGYFTAFILTTLISIVGPVGERQYLK
jgi:ABC-type multidrug transport system ATPase subunit